MEKYFVILRDPYEEFTHIFETKEEMLEYINKCKEYVVVRIIKGKELKLIKKEVVTKYDVEE